MKAFIGFLILCFVSGCAAESVKPPKQPERFSSYSEVRSFVGEWLIELGRVDGNRTLFNDSDRRLKAVVNPAQFLDTGSVSREMTVMILEQKPDGHTVMCEIVDGLVNNESGFIQGLHRQALANEACLDRDVTYDAVSQNGWKVQFKPRAVGFRVDDKGFIEADDYSSFYMTRVRE